MVGGGDAISRPVSPSLSHSRRPQSARPLLSSPLGLYSSPLAAGCSGFGADWWARWLA